MPVRLALRFASASEGRHQLTLLPSDQDDRAHPVNAATLELVLSGPGPIRVRRLLAEFHNTPLNEGPAWINVLLDGRKVTRVPLVLRFVTTEA